MHTVIETPSFIRHAKLAGVTDEERAEMVDAIAANPVAGDIMPGTGGARKVRYARPGSGKSGGYRIITYHAADDVPTFLLDIYGKGQKVNLTQAERNAMADLLAGIPAAYRKSVRDKAEAERAKAR